MRYKEALLPSKVLWMYAMCCSVANQCSGVLIYFGGFLYISGSHGSSYLDHEATFSDLCLAVWVYTDKKGKGDAISRIKEAVADNFKV